MVHLYHTLLPTLARPAGCTFTLFMTYISQGASHGDLGATFASLLCPCFLCYRQLMHIPECQWKTRSSGQDQVHTPLEAVLLAGRFPLLTLLRNNQATHPDLQYKTNDTQKTYNV